MIFIHGGGFDSDSGSEYMYDSSTLCERGVVVVTINYRLGLFGFLSTGDDVMPGNYGMLDQVLAMEWVQKHIRVFGGDHNEVTIFGESAGAASVSLHTISPLSKDLFKRAIMESGASLSAWAVERPTTLIKISSFAKMIGEKVNCTQSDSAEYLTCLRGVDAFSLVVASEEITKELNVSMIATPRVETKFGFLPDYPENLLDKGLFNKVDTLRGYNSGEYSFVIEDDEDNGVTREEFIYFFLKITEKYAFENSTIEELQNLVEDQYLKNETNPLALRTQLIRGLTDLLFALSEALEIDKMSANGNPNSKHYLYQFNFIVDNLLELTSYLPDWMGVLHSAELPMVFVDDSSFNYAVSTHDQRAVGDLVQTMWTNFAKYGNPTENGTAIQWAPYSPANHEILYIDVNSTMTSFPSAHVIPMFNRVLEIIDSKPTS
ncbi:bile salt-activated lipase-like [Physella acuta]|uniref:bile salt-activated lipase-like n=1 Tax=Physella acuta TaxID=109671 RepID=UPI0027DCD552|nr:bile salt-activated lipase-like [Physella acuta]